MFSYHPSIILGMYVKNYDPLEMEVDPPSPSFHCATHHRAVHCSTMLDALVQRIGTQPFLLYISPQSENFGHAPVRDSCLCGYDWTQFFIWFVVTCSKLTTWRTRLCFCISTQKTQHRRFERKDVRLFMGYL